MKELTAKRNIEAARNEGGTAGKELTAKRIIEAVRVANTVAVAVAKTVRETEVAYL